MTKEDNFSGELEEIKAQNEVPVFPENRVRVFYSDYVDSLDEASDVLDEEIETLENDADFLGPHSRFEPFDK